MSKVYAGTNDDLRWKSARPGDDTPELITRLENIEGRIDVLEDMIHELQKDELMDSELVMPEEKPIRLLEEEPEEMEEESIAEEEAEPPPEEPETEET